MITISMINQKGGAGKSSTCFHLAGALAGQGLRVLLIDADPQGSLSQGFFGSTPVEEMPAELTIAQVFISPAGVPRADELSRPTRFEGIEIVCANQHLADFNAPRPEETGMAQYALRDFLEQEQRFDLALIDCPPNLLFNSWAAMVASDYAMIPVPPEDFGTQGLRAVHQAIDQARRLNPGLRRLGHLISRYDRRLLVHQAYESRLRELYAELMFETVIPEAAAFKLALTRRTPVEYSEPRSTAATQMRALAEEVVERMMRRAERQREVA